MRYPGFLRPAVFLRRRKRFLVDVELPDGGTATAHLANTGAMTACTAPRAPVRLSWSDDPRRKLPWSVEQIQVDGAWIVVNTARPNAVVAEAIAAGRVPELAGYPVQKREPRHGAGRLDLWLGGGAAPEAWVEVKNVTLVQDGVARFPDAATLRGTRHVRALAELASPDRRAVLFLTLGHERGRVIRPADDVDPAFGDALRAALDRGVEVIAHRLRADLHGLELAERIPFEAGG